MKKPVLFLIATLLLTASFRLSAQDAKFAVVDLKKVFDGYWKTKQADLNLKERAGELEKRHKEMLEDHKKAREAYQKLLDSANDKALAITERERRKSDAEAKLREIREIEESIQQFDRSARTQIGEQQRNMRDKLVEEIRQTLNGMARARGFAAVLDSSAPLPPAPGVSVTPFLLYSDGLPDLSDALIEQLNASAPAAVLQNSVPTGN
jgi:outer membrane protein